MQQFLKFVYYSRIWAGFNTCENERIYVCFVIGTNTYKIFREDDENKTITKKILSEHHKELIDGSDDVVVAEHLSQTITYSYHSKMGFAVPSTLDNRRLPSDYYFVQHLADFDDILVVAVVAVVVGVAAEFAAVNLVCVRWSQVLNDFRCENRWNDLLTVRLDFGDRLGHVMVGHESHNGVTYHLDSCW